MKFYQLSIGDTFIFFDIHNILEQRNLYRKIGDRRIISFDGRINLTLTFQDKKHLDVIEVLM